ncbi:MAG TPA: YidC/Oxa1 family membrane protein insertase [Candidatus Limnocylindrales bacterium]|nr:YidC/Oxa1 family membrane protein insertase [Candidatus Limnocylindrales bacterium]
MNIFTILVQQPITNALVAIYQGLVSVNVPYALGFSIIALTAAIRLLLYPLTASQMKTQKKMQDIAPHLNKIKEKHKGDMKGQQAATMALYKEHNLNPAAGCLPALLQLPIFFGLYGVLQKAVNLKSIEEINKLLYTDSLKISQLWDKNFFGLPLGKTPRELLPVVGFAIILVPVLTGASQFIQSKMMAVPKTPEEKSKKTNLPAKQEEKKMDFASTFQSQTLYILPIMIGVFSFGFPIGLSLYWNTFTIFGIIQQYRISGWGSLRDGIK